MDKKGFNLIEIAIVLAVIGLVIGGIYTAAASVTQRRLLETYDRQISTVVMNLKLAYAGQRMPSGMATVPYSTLKALQIMPGDVAQVPGTSYLMPDGQHTWTVYWTNIGILVQVWMPRAVCISYITRHFGTTRAMRDQGVTYIASATAGVDSMTGMTFDSAMDLCSTPSGSSVVFYYTY